MSMLPQNFSFFNLNHLMNVSVTGKTEYWLRLDVIKLNIIQSTEFIDTSRHTFFKVTKSEKLVPHRRVL